MPPEEPHAVVVIQLDIKDGAIKCALDRVFAVPGQVVKASWYASSSAGSSNYRPVANGVVQVYAPSVADVQRFDDMAIKEIAPGRFQWRDNSGPNGLMCVLVAPPGQTVVDPAPELTEAKKFDGRVAVFWMLGQGNGYQSVEIEWTLEPLAQELDHEIEALNRRINFARRRPTSTDWDVALSFAGEDRAYVEEVAVILRKSGVKVFYDDFEDLWGKNLYSHLSDVYRNRARFTVMFISKHYAKKRWTNFERESAQSRAFADNREYILPARFDDTEVPGVLPTTRYEPLAGQPPASLAAKILKKLERAG